MTAHSRRSRVRHLLMCPPRHFTVEYSINPWMNPSKPVNTDLAVLQWERLRDLYRDLGHTVHELDPRPGLPDMVFTANGATAVGDDVLLARFTFPQRSAETDAHRSWFRELGVHRIHESRWLNEGEGDFLLAGRRLLAGTGFRTDRRSHAEAERIFGLPVVSLTLVDPRHYHLDTALAVLDGDEIMYWPPAFTPEAQACLARLYPDALRAEDEDAAVFGLNAVCDGRHVILPHTATGLMDQLAARGFEPIGVDVSELLKAGGAVKCSTLEIHTLQA